MSLDDAQTQGLVGTQVAGRYQVTSALASDASRTVYEARDAERGDRVVVIAIPDKSPAAAQFLRVAEKLRSIRHPALAEVLAAGKLDSGEHFLVTERPAGVTLRELTRGKPLPPARALQIARRILEALEVAHAAGQTHGNVNPEVIFVAPVPGGDHVKLAELGVAALTHSKAVDPTYSAPEPIRGISDARVDLYALGAVLYELLTGSVPFVAADREALQRLHTYAPVQPLAQRAPGGAFSEAMERLVGMSLAKNRNSRFRTARDMTEALDQALGQAPSTLAMPEAQAPLPPSAQERPDESLMQLVEEFKQVPPPVDRAPPVPLAPPEASPIDDAPFEIAPIEVPAIDDDDLAVVTPWPTRLRRSIIRTLDRWSAKLGTTRQRLAIGLAAAGGLLLLITIVVCAASGDPPARGKQPQVASPKAPAAGSAGSAAPDPAMQPDALDARCAQLGSACGDTDKRKTKLIDQCKEAARAQVEKDCVDETITLYDCYETTLCGKQDKVWALGDLAVLAGRKSACVAEASAQRACLGE